MTQESGPPLISPPRQKNRGFSLNPANAFILEQIDCNAKVAVREGFNLDSVFLRHLHSPLTLRKAPENPKVFYAVKEKAEKRFATPFGSSPDNGSNLINGNQDSPEEPCPRTGVNATPNPSYKPYAPASPNARTYDYCFKCQSTCKIHADGDEALTVRSPFDACTQSMFQ